MLLELLLLLGGIALLLLMWWMSRRNRLRLPKTPLWYNHLAQRLGLLSDVKARSGNVLKGTRNGFYYNIGGFPIEQPKELYVSIGFKGDFAEPWLIRPKQKPEDGSHCTFDQCFEVLSGDAERLRGIFDQADRRARWQFLADYPADSWEMGIHRDTIYYKEPYAAPQGGARRVDHLVAVLELLYDLGGKSRGWGGKA